MSKLFGFPVCHDQICFYMYTLVLLRVCVHVYYKILPLSLFMYVLMAYVRMRVVVKGESPAPLTITAVGNVNKGVVSPPAV